MPDKKKIIVFDICDTLFYSNTTFEFIQFFHDVQMTAAKRLRFKILFSRRSPIFWTLVIYSRVKRRDFLKELLVLSLKNQSRENIDALATFFFREKLYRKRISETFLLFDRLKKEHIILLSATIEPVAKAIAKNLEVGYRATELEEINGRYTGKIKNELSGRKLSQLKEDEDFQVSLVVSDNHNDLPLFGKSLRSIAICYSRNDVHYWRKHSTADILHLTHKSPPYTYIKTAI